MLQSKFPTSFPIELESLFDRRYLFRYKVTNNFNIEKGSRTYTVKRLTKDPSIIDQFLEKNEVINLYECAFNIKKNFN